MFASAPSKLPQSANRTSHPSRLSLRSYCLSSIPSEGSASAWPAPSCSRVDKKRHSISTGRFPGDASNVRLFSFNLWIPFHSGLGHALPPIPTHLASFVAHHSVASLLGNSRWLVAVESSSAHPAHGFEKHRICLPLWNRCEVVGRLVG